MDDERSRIDRFLSSQRIALVGASRRPEAFSRAVMQALLDHGIEVIPVHPTETQIDGHSAYPSVCAIDSPVDAVLIMTPASSSAEIVEDCARAGVRRVWLHRGAGAGAVSDAAVKAGEAHGLELVVGRCPMMFLGDKPAWPHRAHAWWLRVKGRYPVAS